MSDKLLEDLGNHLQKLRIEAGYKIQKDLAKALNVSKSTIGNYEQLEETYLIVNIGRK